MLRDLTKRVSAAFYPQHVSAPNGPQPFQIFLEQHRTAVLGFLRAAVGPTDADDCFQETFIAALRAYDRMDGRHPRAWLMTIARNKAIDHHRARARRPEPREWLPEQAVTDEVGGGEVWKAVGALPEGRRVAVALRYAADLAYAEIASILGCSEEAARRRVADGLASLRADVDREELVE